MADLTARYLARVRATYPGLAISSARGVETESQFNDVLVVNEALVLRFPRNAQAPEALAHEVAVLRRLQGRLPLPVPNPELLEQHAATGAIGWMGYALIPGEPLWDEELDALGAADRRQIAQQLADFLHALHTLPPAEVAPELPARDETRCWAGMFAAFRDELPSFMRLAARSEVDALRDALLAELECTDQAPALIHGDFGGNILYDPGTRRVTGVIDFGGVAHGDDWAEVVDADTALFAPGRATGMDWFPAGEFGTIACPVLLTASLTDSLLPAMPAQTVAMVRQIPDCRLLLVNGGDHPLLWSRPREARAAVDTLLTVGAAPAHPESQ